MVASLHMHVALHIICGFSQRLCALLQVMAGYAGWAPYQLSQEVKNGSWWIVAASKDVILDSLNGVWGVEWQVEVDGVEQMRTHELRHMIA